MPSRPSMHSFFPGLDAAWRRGPWHGAHALAARAMALAAALLLAACSGDDDAVERTQPLPWAEGQPRAYTEAYLAQHPAALVRPEHVVAVRLEAVADGQDDTGAEPGVDEIHYLVERPRTVVLHADQAAAARLSHVVLKDAAGRELARHRASDGAAAAVTLSLDAGVYRVEAHHAAKGDPAAPPLTVFLRLADAGQTLVRNAGGDDGDRLQASAVQTTLVATAGTSCIGCTFDHAAMANAHYDGADLSQSSFVGTVLDGASLKLATCSSCTFTSASLNNTNFNGSVLSSSDFGSAAMGGASLSYNYDARQRTVCTQCNFGGANLAYAELFDAVLTGSFFNSSHLDYTDFTYADCQGCFFYNFAKYTFPLIYFQGARLNKAFFYEFLLGEGRFDGAVLDGASLFGFGCTTCSFGLNPSSANQPTSLVGIKFIGVEIDNANYEGADLTGASLGLANSSTFYPLMGAGSLKNARLHAITPADYFSAQKFGSRRNKGRVDLSGASFAGMDLSHADFSSASALVTAATDFGTSTLSDGTTGIDLSGQDLSGFKAFAGRDLRGAKFNGTTLYEADLHGANLGNASLAGANLSYASLQGARLVGAQAGVAAGAGSVAARFTGAYMVGADLTDADLRSTDLSLAHLYGGVAFVRTRLDSAALNDALLAEADFTQASLNDTTFGRAVLVNARFGGAALVNTKFDSAYLQGTDFTSVASLQGVTLTSAAVSTQNGNWPYKEQDGTPFTYAYGATALGAIATGSAGVACPNGQTGPCTTPASLTPLGGGPFPPAPACVPKPPRYDNCLPPKP